MFGGVREKPKNAKKTIRRLLSYLSASRILVIFMIVTPMLTKSPAGVRLPETPEPASLGAPEERVEVAVRADGTALWKGRTVTGGQLLDALREARSRSAGKPVTVVADRGLSMASVRDVMRIAREAGYPGLELATTKERR